MRVLIRLALPLTLSITPCLASAKAPRQKQVSSDTAPTESASARATRLALAEDVGARKETELRATGIGPQAVTTGDASSPERGIATAQPAPERSIAPLSGALEDLVAKQMQRFGGPLDHCVAEAKLRDAHASGDVEVAVRVLGKQATIERISGGDAALGACFSALKTVRFSLPDLAFSWHLSLTSPGDHREMATR